MHDLTLAELAEALASRACSSEELTTHLLARIEQYDGELNSLITVDAENALAAARQADAERSAGRAGRLTGVPLIHKDIFLTAGVRTSCGSRMLADFVPPFDATVVERCRQAGMVMLGKANMDEFAMGSSNETSHFGPVHNPWDTARVPGGSSGGSAAAVAAGLAPAATGTDPRDSTSAELPVPDYAAALTQPLAGLRVGVVEEFFGEGLDAGVAGALEAAVGVLQELGAEVSRVHLPQLGLSVPTYYVIAPAEASSNLSRFDGVRYGYRCEAPKDLEDLYKRSRGEGFGAEVKRRIMIGTYVLSAGYYDAYYLKAQRCRRLITDDFRQAFEQVDVLVAPSAPEVAFRLGEKTDDPLKMYLSDINTIAVNLAGLPGISVPAGQVQGLPVGLQLIGRHFEEARLLNVAHQFQRETDWHRQRPARFA